MLGSGVAGFTVGVGCGVIGGVGDADGGTAVYVGVGAGVGDEVPHAAATEIRIAAATAAMDVLLPGRAEL